MSVLPPFLKSLALDTNCSLLTPVRKILTCSTRTDTFLGSQIFAKLLPNERLNDALMGTLTLIRRSRFVRSLYRLWGYITGRPQPEAPEDLCSKTIVEERELILQRETLRDQWHQQWNSQGLDFVLTVTHPFPALANGDGVKASLMSASYTFLFNLVCHLLCTYTLPLTPLYLFSSIMLQEFSP